MRKQYDCADTAKLLMALFIVAVHTNLLRGALYPVLRLAVPVFFILTGFFAFSKISAAPAAQRKQTLWRIEKRYLQLYLFWFIVLIPFTLYVRQYHTFGFPAVIGVFLRDLLWGSTFQASWYLMACVQGVAAVYLLSKAKPALSLSVGIALYILATVTSKYQLLIEGSDIWGKFYEGFCRATGEPYNNVCIAIVYILIGKLIAQRKIRPIGTVRSLLGFAVCCAGLLFEFHLAKRQLWFIRSCDCWFLLAPAAVFFVLFILSLDIKIPKAPVMRSVSTVIYCAHLAIATVVSKAVSVLGIPDPDNLTVFFATAVCSIAAALVILRLEKRKGLGFLRFSH